MLNPHIMIILRCKCVVLVCLIATFFGVLSAHDLEQPQKAEPSVQRQGTAGIHGIFEVDPDSGAASLYFPLGAGIGRPGLGYVPALVGRFAPQVGIAPLPGTSGGAVVAPVLLATTAFELSPGYLDWPLAPVGDSQLSAIPPVVRWVYPDGSGGSSGGTLAFAVDPKAVLARFGYGSGAKLACLPRIGASIPAAEVLLGTGGDYIFAVSDEVRFPEQKLQPEEGGPGQWILPSCLLVVRSDLAYEFQLAQTWHSDVHRSPGFAHYRLAALRSPSGDAITFTYGINEVDFEATWATARVRVALDGVVGMPPVPAMDAAPWGPDPQAQSREWRNVGVRLRIASEGVQDQGYVVTAMTRSTDMLEGGDPLVGGLNGGQTVPGPEPQLGSFRRNLQVTLVQGDSPDETVQFFYGKTPFVTRSGACGTQPFAVTVLREIAWSGQSLNLSWQGQPSPSEAEGHEPSFWSFGVEAVRGTEASVRAVVRQSRHFAVTGGPCSTFVRDRWEIGQVGGPWGPSGPVDGQNQIPYRYGRDIPTFWLDPQERFLVPVSGQLTRWVNGPEGWMHQKMGLLGGGDRGSMSKPAGRGSGGASADGPSGGGKSTGGIRNYDRTHSKPGGPSGGGTSTAGIRAYDRTHSQPGNELRSAASKGSGTMSWVPATALPMGTEIGFRLGGVLFGGVTNLVSNSISETTALNSGAKWVGEGNREIAPGVFRSQDGLRQFRMTSSDLDGCHGSIGRHVHFEALDGAGEAVENLHVPIIK